MSQSKTLKILMIVLATIGMFFAAKTSEAIIINDKSGAIGLTDGKTARFSVANVGEINGFEWCIHVYDLEGNVIAQTPDQRLEAGKITYFDLNRDDLTDTRGRLELRVEFEFMDPTERNGKALKRRVRANIQIINNTTGQTEVYVGDATQDAFD
jgi:hypothetical protein